MLPRSTNRWLHSKGFTLVLFTACLCTTVRVLRADEPKVHPPITASAIQARLAEMQLQATMNELVKVRVELRRARAEAATMGARLRHERQGAIPVAEIELWVTKDPEVQASRARVAVLKRHVEDYASTLVGGKGNSAFQAATKDLEKAEQHLISRKRKLKPIAEEEIRSSRDKKLEREIHSRIAERVTPLETLEQELVADIERLSKELESSPPPSDPNTKTAIRQIRDLQERIRQITKETDDILRKLEDGAPKK